MNLNGAVEALRRSFNQLFWMLPSMVLSGPSVIVCSAAKATRIEYEKIDSRPRELPVQSSGVRRFAWPVFFENLQSLFDVWMEAIEVVFGFVVVPNGIGYVSSQEVLQMPVFAIGGVLVPIVGH